MYEIKLKILVLFLICTVFYGSIYAAQVQAKSIGGEVGVTINPVNVVVHVNYIDEDGNKIEEDYSEAKEYAQMGTILNFSLDKKVISGYKYSGFYYKIEVSGKESTINTDSDPVITVDDIYSEDLVSSVCTYTVYIVYTKSTSKTINGEVSVSIRDYNYTFNMKYIDTKGIEINQSYIETAIGVQSTFSLKISDVADYQYTGYYYENVTGEKGINSGGSISNVLTNNDPVIITNSEGKDAEDGYGTYNVYAVYSKSNSSSITETTTEQDTNEASDSNSVTNAANRVTEGDTWNSSNILDPADTGDIHFLGGYLLIMIFAIVSIFVSRYCHAA